MLYLLPKPQQKQHARADKLTKLITEFRKEGERLLAPFDTLRLENNSSDSASAEEIEKDLSTAKQEVKTTSHSFFM